MVRQSLLATDRSCGRGEGMAMTAPCHGLGSSGSALTGLGSPGRPFQFQSTGNSVTITVLQFPTLYIYFPSYFC